MILAYNLAAVIFRHIDRITLVICFFLASIGLVMLARLDMELAVKQLIWMVIGILVLFFTVVVIKRARDFGRLNYFFDGSVVRADCFRLSVRRHDRRCKKLDRPRVRFVSAE